MAKVGDSTISKDEFDRWYKNAAAGATQGGQVVAPDPPDFEKCVAGLQEQPQPEGAGEPTEDALKKQCEQQYEDLRDQVMQFLIQAEWVQQEAEERDVAVSDEEVKKSFDDQKKQAFPKEADYQKFLEDNGMSEEDILFRVKLDQLQTKLTKKITEDKATPTDEEVAAEYEKNKKSYAVPESRDVSLVLTKTEARANEARPPSRTATASRRSPRSSPSTTPPRRRAASSPTSPAASRTRISRRLRSPRRRTC